MHRWGMRRCSAIGRPGFGPAMTPGFGALLIMIALVDGVSISTTGPGGTHPPVGGLKRWLAVILVLVGVYLMAGG